MTALRTVTVRDRRRALVARHQLAGAAADPAAVVRALIALHATDPASVYISVLARSTTSTLADVAAAMYEQRAFVRWLAMRRTLFVFDRDDVPAVQAAVSRDVAAALRRRLVTQLQRNGTEPALGVDPAIWLADVETRVEAALAQRGAATGAQLSTDEPGLRTRILARTASERPHTITTPLLTLMSAEGRLVRAAPTGAWTTRQHTWEPVAAWWPDGLPVVDRDDARSQLARRWLQRFGPATVDDLRWWTGWNLTVTRRALAAIPLEEIDLHGEPGIALAGAAGELGDPESVAPVAALLPTLDPTPMGWQDRRWFLGVDPAHLFDRAGNIGPTVWWDGEIIGSWTTAPSGDLRISVLADRGRDARDAVDVAGARLHARLDGAVITPAVRTPLEHSLRVG